MKNFLWLPLALVLSLTLLACGGGDDDDDGGENLTENALAEAALLTLDDLPGGWSVEADEEDAGVPNPLDKCDTTTDEGQTGRAESPDFSDGGTGTIQFNVAVFENQDAVVESLDSFDGVADCIVDEMNDGALDNNEVEFSDASVDDLDIPELGDERLGFRIEATGTPIGEGFSDEDAVPVFIDAAFIVVDRLGVAVIATDVITPFADLDELIDAAVAKAVDAQSGGGSDDDEETATPDDDEESATPDEDDDGGAIGEDYVPFGDDTVIVGRMQVAVTDVNFDAEGIVLAANSSNEATPGKNMIVMQLDVTNVGDGPLDVFFEPFFHLIGDNGTEYNEFDPSCGLVPNELEGEIDPGDSIVGNVCVQADEDDDNLVFFIEMTNDAGDDERAYFELK